MELIFEKSKPGLGCNIISECDVPLIDFNEKNKRNIELNLPEVSEGELSRHYSALERRSHGVNNGFYPLGSCTMKYNPKINDEVASFEKFTDIHPLQDEESLQGCLEIYALAEEYLSEITGMDAMTFQPAAGAHGEYTGIAMIKAYHSKNGEINKRTKMLVPDSAHGTNPASAVMNGFQVITIPSDANGYVDIEALKAAAGEDTAGLLLTNPNTLGLFDPNILEITKIVHDAGGLNYYDGANLNAIMGVCRPGEMGFDVIHLNLHKTFSTPHGGGGPGSGAVGCKNILESFLPSPVVVKQDGKFAFDYNRPHSIGKVQNFYGNFLVTLRAVCYILSLGKEGIPLAAKTAVLNANYLMKKLSTSYNVAYEHTCMHEFVLTLKELKKQTGVSALDISKGLLDFGIHPPTMYFPLIVEEALMLEPTETESKQTLDKAADVFEILKEKALNTPEELHSAPKSTPVKRPDEVNAARNPVLRYIK